MPFYHVDLLKIALDDPILATEVPKFFAFDGKSNAVNAIAGNIYKILYQEAIRWARREEGMNGIIERLAFKSHGLI